jgi:hypothetical protein
MTVIALLGANALYLTYAWLASAIAAGWLSNRKGYGERAGIATGLLLNFVAVIVWLVFPARPDSRWKVQGALPFGKRTKTTVAEARAEGITEDKGQ